MRRLSSKTWGSAAALALVAGALAGCAGFLAAGPIPTPGFPSEPPLGILTPTGRASPPATDDPPFGATLAATAGVLPTAGDTVTPPHTPMASFTPATPCANQACASAVSHFWLDRPIPSDSGYSDIVER